MKNTSPPHSTKLHLLSLVTALMALALPGRIATARGWTQVPTPTANDLPAVHFSDSLNGYACGAFGTLLKTGDGGLTWAPVLLDGIGGIHAAAWRSEQEGFLFTFSNTSHRTTDGGDSWTLVSDSMDDAEGNRLPAIVTDALIDADGLFIGVDFSGNFLESDDAATWAIIPGSRDPLIALTQLPDGSLVAVGNAGAIWRSPATRAYEPPKITRIELGEDGEGEVVTIDATGTPGLTYQLASSRDLSAAWKVETSLSPAESRFQFTVGKPAAGRWFYRIEEQSARRISR